MLKFYFLSFPKTGLKIKLYSVHTYSASTALKTLKQIKSINAPASVHKNTNWMPRYGNKRKWNITELLFSFSKARMGTMNLQI